MDPNRSQWVGRRRAVIGALLVLSGAIYSGAISGGFVWDDRWIVETDAFGANGSLVHCFTRPFMGHYFRPLVSVAILIERSFFGRNPLPFHLVNIALHVVTTAVIIGLAFACFRRRDVAILSGAFFAVQPAQVGATAWIGGLTDALATLWTALFGWALVLAARSPADRRSKFFVASIVSYLLVLFTKEQAIGLVLVVPLAFACWKPDRGVNSPAKAAWATLPFLASAILFLSMGMFLGIPRPAAGEYGYATAAETALRTTAYYTLILLFPTPALLHTYTLDGFRRAGAWPVLLAIAVVATAAYLLARCIRSNRPAAWLLAFAALPLLPVSNIVPLSALQVASYRAALSGIGIAILVASANIAIFDRLTFRSSDRLNTAGIMLIAFVAVLLAYQSGLTAWAVTRWTEERLLFGTIVRYDPACGQAQYNLACAEMRAGAERAGIKRIEALLGRIFGSDAWKTPESAGSAFRTDSEVVTRIRNELGAVETPEYLFGMLYNEMGRAYMRLSEWGSAENSFGSGLAINPGDRRCLEGLEAVKRRTQ